MALVPFEFRNELGVASLELRSFRTTAVKTGLCGEFAVADRSPRQLSDSLPS
jgi:hypothetical protein